ncbi:MAG: hypothetical protein ACRDTV_06015, partial [Mycobacterium sp.]
SGDWTPPTIASIGVMVIVTHPGFSGGAGQFFGFFDLTNPLAPAWNSANTAVNGLPGVPQAVANFNNRAWFAVGNQMWYTDVLTNPPTVTNATQFLVIGDPTSVNALSGLPVQTTSSGVLQTLTVFKPTQIWQISGDDEFSNLALNYVSLTTGTNAPRSVVQAPTGMYFSTTGGPFFLDFLGNARPLTHAMNILEPDIQTPFEQAVDPTRWAATYNSTIYRICGSTVIQGRSETNDYWFDEHKRRWTGPHTFNYDCATALAGYFVLSSVNHPGILVKSTPVNLPSSTVADLGTQLVPYLLSSTFPKVDWMAMKQVAESQIELASGSCVTNFTIEAMDDQGAELGVGTIQVTNGGSIWGSFNWGQSNWGCPLNTLWGGAGLKWGATPIGSGLIWGQGLQRRIPHTYPVPWGAPLVFEKMQIQITVDNPTGISIGTFFARYQKTGYMVMQ